ncbi:unnamed protein product, partial [Porites evermanni]
CSSFVLDNPSDSQNIPLVTIPEPTWTQTPSIVKIANGHYQALGRVIHMKYLHDQLIEHEDFSFADSRRSMDDLVQQLDILADTLYIK